MKARIRFWAWNGGPFYAPDKQTTSQAFLLHSSRPIASLRLRESLTIYPMAIVVDGNNYM